MRRTFIKIIVNCIIFCIPVCIIKANVAIDTVRVHYEQVEHNLLSKNWNSDVYSSPGVKSYQYAQKLSSLGVNYLDRDEKIAYMSQKGDRLNSWQIVANSYLPFKKSNVLWGTAYYRQDYIKNITYCSTADFDMLYPHIIADLYLHNSFTEEYSFSGGYAKKHNRWSWGLFSYFRALDEYRRKDPRAFNVVSELEIASGASYKVKEKYSVFCGAAVKRYKQSSSVRSFASAIKRKQFFMLGPSSYYAMFSTENILALYQGYTFGVNAGMVSHTGVGPELFLSYKRMNFDRADSKVNLTPVTSMIEDNSRSVLTWKGKFGNFTYGAKFLGEYIHRTGIEYLLGSVVYGVYPVKASFEQYYSTRLNLISSLLFEYNLENNFTIGLSPYGGIRNYDEKCLLPSQQQKIHTVNVGGDFILQKTFGKRNLLVLSFRGDFIKVIDKKQYLTDGKLIIKELNMNYERGKIMEKNFRIMTTDYFMYDAGLKYSFAFSDNLSLYISAHYAQRAFAVPKKNHCIEVSSGILF